MPLAVIFSPRRRSMVSSNPKTNSPVWGKARDQQPQQEVTRGQGRPTRTIQDPVIVDETLLLAQPHDTQARRHRAFARGENCADQQDFGVFPDGLGKERRKLYNQGHNSAGSVSIGKTPFGEEVFLSLRCLPLLFQRPKMAKVEISSRVSKTRQCL